MQFVWPAERTLDEYIMLSAWRTISNTRPMCWKLKQYFLIQPVAYIYEWNRKYTIAHFILEFNIFPYLTSGLFPGLVSRMYCILSWGLVIYPAYLQHASQLSETVKRDTKHSGWVWGDKTFRLKQIMWLTEGFIVITVIPPSNCSTGCLDQFLRAL